MTAFLIHNMAPLMFGALVIFLLIGYPVAFALAANGIFFGLVGIELGLLHPTLFQAIPERIWGVMSNDTLLAIPFFTFMGLVLERSGREVAERVFKFRVRLYEARVDGATDVSAVASLRDAALVPMRKRLILDLQAAGARGPIDNLEGMAWGPVRPDGRRTLVMVADDNFSPQQVTQVLAFEVAP